MIELRSIVGRPWALPPCPPASFDCWALVKHVRDLYGKPTPSASDHEYKRVARQRDYIVTPPSDWLMTDRPTTGCVVRIGLDHVGVYIGDNDIIHSQVGRGVVVDHLKLMVDELTFWEQRDVD